MKKPDVRSRVNSVFRWIVKGDERPVFFDIDATLPQLREFERQFDVVREELLPLLDRREELPRYHELDTNQTYISGGSEKRWNVFMFYSVGRFFPDNRAACPRTCEILDGIPNLFQSFVSILEAGKSIPAHEGSYLGYLRYHLGIRIPENDPPSIRVRDQMHVWREGESVLFDDSWEHEVYNESDGDRVVLIVDVFRPMPWPGALLNRAFTLLFGRRYARRVAAREKESRRRGQVEARPDASQG